MAFTAQDVKTLRERTNCGMMDCKKALADADGDMERAIEILREKGLAKQAKKAGRIAAEGLVQAYVDEANGCGVVIEVNAETDFVAKNADFVKFVDDCAKTVAVVVPSPASSLVFDATSRTICAPILANVSSNSTSLATVTPSLVTCGAPNFLSIMTLRPLGPSVTFTALHNASTPSLRSSRASTLYLISFAIIFSELKSYSITAMISDCFITR